MRIISLLAISVSLVLSFSYCTKTASSNSVNGNTSPSILVKSYQVVITDSVLANTSTQYTVTYSFDNNNRQTAATQTGTQTYKGVVSNMNYNFQFTYGQGTQTETGTVQLGNLNTNSTSVYTLNSSGYPDKLVTNSTVGTINSVFTSLYKYDANGYCTEVDNSSVFNNINQPSTKTLFTISGGNVVEEDNYDAGGGLISTVSYTFGSNSNKTILRFSTPPLSGHLNNDLVESSNASAQGVPKSALNYSYTFDSQGRVSGCTATTSKGQAYMKFSNIQYLN